MDRDFKQHRIYRNGIFIVTVPNNSFYTDHPNGRGHASYIHKVCGGAAERVFRCSERNNSFTDDQSSASAITQGDKTN